MRRFKLLKPGNKSLAVTGKYKKIYSIGSMVIDDNTLGYILFDCIQNLIEFVQMLCRHQDDVAYSSQFFVAEIDTIGDEVIPDALSSCVYPEKYLDEFYNDGTNGYTDIPKGTICCKEIEVLDIRQLYQY
jgi:hypothetical protein